MLQHTVIEHPIPPTWNNESEILILGSFPSVKSRETGYFYGHPQNRFWRVLSAIYEDVCPATKKEKEAFLFRHHIAVWDVISSMLIELGYTVILAENGRDAVEIYENNPHAIDLVLMDMIMPEMNAREAFHLLKKIDPNVKVLLSSGYVSEEDAKDVLDAGALGFLRKPYRMSDLAKAIRNIFDVNK